MQNQNEQLLLKQVDNVTAESRGIWQRLFKYGDVHVALVGADYHRTFDNVANPLEVQEEITRRQARIKQLANTEQQRQQREIIGEYLSAYHESIGQGQAYIPPDAMPQATEIRDRSRPPLVPRQNPPRPSMSEGRPYQPDNQQGYEYRPPQRDIPYPQQPYPQQTPHPQPGQYEQPPQQPPAPDSYPSPPNFSPPPPQQRPNPPMPPLPRDTGRPPKFPRRKPSS
jgi:hypothetical protein